MKSIMKGVLSIIVLCVYNYVLTGQTNGGVVDVEYRVCTGCSSTEDLDKGDADSTFTYAAKIKYKTKHIVSDFGPRYLSQNSYFDWHGGVDFSAEKSDKDRGDALIPLKLGRVYLTIVYDKNKPKKSGYKWIGIDASGDEDYGYGHIFSESTIFPVQSGGFILKKQLKFKQDEYAIILPGRKYAIGQHAGEVIIGNDTLTVDTMITSVHQAIGIAPVGDAIRADRDVESHLHLYRFSNFTNGTTDGKNTDPLEYINHDEPTYDLSILKKDDVTKGVQLSYYSTVNNNSLSPVQVRVKMNGESTGGSYTKSVMNVSTVDVKIKNTVIDSVFSMFKGPFYNSIINKGARKGEVPYPKGIINKNRDSGWPSTKNKNQATTGIQPFAYKGSTTGHPYDDYYFADFMTRIHKNDAFGKKKNLKIADHPENSRFTDGKYKVMATVMTVKGDSINSSEEEFILDNYMPYIRSVSIEYNNAIIGELIRKCDEKVITKANDGTINSKIINQASSATESGDLKVTVEVSEPLDSLQMNIPKLNLIGISSSSNDKLKYVFEKENVSLFDSTDLCLSIEFTGKDFSGNTLLNIGKMSNGNSGNITLPKRIKVGNSNSNWIPVITDKGIDSLTICIGTCSESGNLKPKGSSENRYSGSCLDLFLLEEIVVNSNCKDNTGSIDILHPDFSDDFTISWFDESGIYMDQYDDMFEINGLAPGQYCYVICGIECSFKGCKTVNGIIPISDINLKIIENLSEESPLATISISDDNPPYNITWMDRYDSIILEEIIDSFNSSSLGNLVDDQEYCVNVVNSIGCQYDYCFIRNETECDGSYDIILDYETSPSCSEDGTIEVVAINGEFPYNYHWNDGNTSAIRTGLSEGLYKVTVTDSKGCFVVDSINIKSYPLLSISTNVVIIPSSCDGSTGIIDYWKVDGHGGAGSPYYLDWSNGDTGIKIENLPAGEYTLTVTDSEGCTITATHTVLGLGQPYLALSTTEKTCAGLSHGKINLQFIPDIGPLTVQFEDGLLDYTITNDLIEIDNLHVGTYCIIVTDEGNGCFTKICETVEELTDYIDLTISSSSFIQHSCDGEPNGWINLSFYGGVGEFSFLWSNGETSDILGNLMPGNYSVTVSDECNNQASKEFEIIGTNVDINVEAVVHCVSSVTKKGKIDLTVTGTNKPYSYFWSNFTYEEDLEVTDSGIYSVKIIDSNGCSVERTYQVGDTDGDLSASVILGDLNNCTQYLEMFASAIVSGGVQPYKFSWSGGGNESTKSFALPNSDSPEDLSYRVTITDNCNQQVVLSDEFMCNDVCPDNCVEFRRDGHPGCVDVCDDAALDLFLDDYFCDEFEIKSTCDDGIIRTFFWGNAVSDTWVSTTFEGKEVIDGEDEKDVSKAGPGWANAWVKNEDTGCVKWLSLWIPEKCFSLWNWFWECKRCGSLGGSNPNPPDDDTECLEWDYTEGDDCSLLWKCIDPPNTYPDIIDPTVEYCIATYDESTQVEGLELLYESCECDWIGNLHIDIGNYEEFCPCSSLNFTPIDTGTTNIMCSTNPKDIYYDYDQDSYVYLTTEYGSDSIVYPYVTNKKFSIDKAITLSPIRVQEGILQSVSLDSSRNIILHINKYGQDNVIKYDSIGQIIWEYKFEYQGILEVYIKSDIKSQTTLIATYTDSSVQVVINDIGDIISTDVIPVIGENFYSVISNSYINVSYSSFDKNKIKYNNIDQGYSWEYEISNEVVVEKYFKDIDNNIIIFYNYKKGFTIDGKYVSLQDKISSGVFVLTPYGELIRNYPFYFAQNLIITDVAQGVDNEFSLIGYYSNISIQNCSNFQDNPEVCSFLIGLDMNTNIGIGNRNGVVEVEQNLLVFPNPSSSPKIDVSLSIGNEVGELNLFDSYNNLIFNKKDVYLSTEEPLELEIFEQITPGVYILSFKGGKVNISRKVIFVK